MDPKLIVFNFFFLLSIGSIDKVQKVNSFNDFVVKKKTAYSIDPININQRLMNNQVETQSIMHKMTQKEKLAIFCKMEHEVMQASGFAVKFRLGDQAYVDQLEGK